MLARISEQLDARFTFVVGKGGVGKTTSSSALALWWADRGEHVRLLSTDPAHSVGDAFAQTLVPGEPTPSTCSANLLLEELDTAGRARDWLAEIRGPVAELVELGTYLDADHVVPLLDRALPGMDELVALLRLVELSASETGRRVVVDTAPAGHTLRLLDADAVLASWSGAMEAMAAKAAAVSVGLTGQRPRLAGNDVILRMREGAARFREAVLEQADFVVVTRADPVVRAETGRLVEALRARGCRLRVLISVGTDAGAGTSDLPAFGVPLRPGLIGCDGLRGWGLPSGTASEPETGAATGLPSASVLDVLRGRDLYLFVGKGGVGKSTCAAAFALALGAERDVLLLGTDPSGSLSDVLGVPVGGAETALGPGVAARELDAHAELTSFRARYRDQVREALAGLGVDESMPLDRRMLESLVDLAPAGVDEIFALDAILEGTSAGGRALVVDAAPTGHLLRLLEMPDIARGWARTILRILLEYRSLLGLGDFASKTLAFARRVEALAELLVDPARAGAVVVTLDGELPRRETERLGATLSRNGTPIAAVVHNRYSGGGASFGGPAARREAPPRILAPALREPPVGADALRGFFERWSLA